MTEVNLAGFSSNSSLVERRPSEFISNVDVTVAGAPHHQVKQRQIGLPLTVHLRRYTTTSQAALRVLPVRPSVRLTRTATTHYCYRSNTAEVP